MSLSLQLLLPKEDQDGVLWVVGDTSPGVTRRQLEVRLPIGAKQCRDYYRAGSFVNSGLTTLMEGCRPMRRDY